MVYCGSSMRMLRRHTPLALAFAFFAAGGCGDESAVVDFKRSGSAPPADCVQRWNADPLAVNFGLHMYQGHHSRAARVYPFDKPETGLANQCVVVFAIAENDREFGTDGQVSTSSGWVNMTTIPVKSERERIAIQRSGAQQANVKLAGDGKIAPFE